MILPIFSLTNLGNNVLKVLLKHNSYMAQDLPSKWAMSVSVS